jgi:hypothetical protein
VSERATERERESASEWQWGRRGLAFECGGHWRRRREREREYVKQEVAKVALLSNARE